MHHERGSRQRKTYRGVRMCLTHSRPNSSQPANRHAHISGMKTPRSRSPSQRDAYACTRLTHAPARPTESLTDECVCIVLAPVIPPVADRNPCMSSMDMPRSRTSHLDAHTPLKYSTRLDSVAPLSVRTFLRRKCTILSSGRMSSSAFCEDVGHHEQHERARESEKWLLANAGATDGQTRQLNAAVVSGRREHRRTARPTDRSQKAKKISPSHAVPGIPSDRSARRHHLRPRGEETLRGGPRPRPVATPSSLLSLSLSPLACKSAYRICCAQHTEPSLPF